MDFFEFASTGWHDGYASATWGNLGDFMAGEDLNISFALKEIWRVDAKRVGVLDHAGDQMRQAAGGVGNVRALFVNKNLKMRIHAARPARRAQACSHSTHHH